MIDAGETIVGRAGEGISIEDKEESNNLIITRGGSSRRFLCTNCKNNVHCISGGKKDQPVEMLKILCSNDNCMCTCKTHYEARNGRLKKLGTIDDTDVLEGFSKQTERTETDVLIDKLNAEMRESKK